MVKNFKSLNDKVRAYWEKEPCGTGIDAVEKTTKFSIEYFEAIESNRYKAEPFIHSIAQFSRSSGRRVLEIGVGAGTDHLQWARSGAELYGVDLTEAAIEMVSKRLKLYGVSSMLKRTDAEKLDFQSDFFDLVYSWGVIHHSERPEKIISEVLRVLKPGGEFVGMFYNRCSLFTFRVWFRFAFLKFKPWLSFSHVLFNNVESIGTKAYTRYELEKMFSNFSEIEIMPFITEGDTSRLPKWIKSYIPQKFGWFYGIRAKKCY